MHVDAEKLVENTRFTVTARMSMIATPFLIGALGYFLLGVHGDVIELQAEMPKVKERVAVMEANQQRGREDREEFQRQTIAQLNQIQELIRVQLQGQAALTATVNAQQKQIDQILNNDRRR